MWQYILRRFTYMIFTVWIISLITFAVIQLPPGDYVSTMVSQMINSGMDELPPDFEQEVRAQYGLDQPIYVQYYKWMRNIIRDGEFGYSWIYRRDAKDIMVERLPASFAISAFSVLFIWMIALPIGIYSAVKQYSLADYTFTLIGFIGLAVPNFLFALILLFISYKYMDQAMIGLYSQKYETAPWSLAKFWDLVKHLWIPVVIIGTSGTAGLIRTMRANLLDELNKPYVDTARSKGLSETTLLWRYPVRHALNPFISTIGWILPSLIAGELIVSIVLNLPTSGPVIFNSLMDQDMYVAAGFILILSTLTVLGTFISDLMLALLDPRIRLS
ncbi:MAG: ABC transporter permease [Anaerolineae bacterium]|nr:ABC transporter permease [Anaerolineae bacterium]